MPSIEELRILQALPLSLKVRRSQQRIREWIDRFGTDGVYVSFSGGKDSTVLLHLVRELYPEVPAVFVNTGLEYPEIQRFARSFENVVTLRPEMAFPEVISKYGYPFISKEVSQDVYEVRRAHAIGHHGTMRERKLEGTQLAPDGTLSSYNIPQWRPLLETDFWISHYCCNVMKKGPAKAYGKTTGRHPIMAMMTAESRNRESAWIRQGCNAFNSKRPTSNPMAFWLENDVLEFVKAEGIKIAPVYGDIVVQGGDGFEYYTMIGGGCKYRTTGCYRTGCIFCGFGAHLEKGEGRFERLKRTHPKQYDYCMGGGAYGEDGIWRPSKEGLGMAHVIDELCRLYGPGFIKY